jgi:putative PEP-CTERM system histidine kinase
MVALVTQWGHALAAFLFAALVLWQATVRQGGAPRIMLVIACAATAIWCLAVATRGPAGVTAGLTQNLADLTWLGFMFAIHPQPRARRRPQALPMTIYGGVALTLLAGIIVRLLPIVFEGSPRIQEGIFVAVLALRIASEVGALVLVHNLFSASSPEARWGIALPMGALAVMWSFDLNLSLVAYLLQHWPPELFALRGFLLALLAPLLVTISRYADVALVRPSRSITFRSASLLAMAAYAAVVVLVARLLALSGNLEMLGQITVAIGFSSLALMLFPSTRLRSGLKSGLARHLFQHRYDYRVEWRQFTDTLGLPGQSGPPLAERMVQAIADIPDAPGGLLLMTAEDGGLEIAARWGWRELGAPQRAGSRSLAGFLQMSGQVIELAAVRDGDAAAPPPMLLPDWMLGEPSAWILVPLIHFDRLVGAVLLEQPAIGRGLDWEDHDLLRLAGRQVASYLAEARGQEALSDARRFDEFNRRFAFIMHDVKNLVSQLSLLARNAERHADNPDFRADMIATLQSSVGKMNELLARLSQHHRSHPQEPAPHALKPLIEAIAGPRGIKVQGRPDIMALVDPARFHQAFGHLIQNAVEASPNDEPVEIILSRRDHDAMIELIDHGHGMSAEFIRSRLFHAFASTKDGGFGIGAFEARSLVTAMGGRIEVESQEGEGSRFTILLPTPTISADAGSIQRAQQQQAQQ